MVSLVVLGMNKQLRRDILSIQIYAKQSGKVVINMLPPVQIKPILVDVDKSISRIILTTHST